MDIRKSAEDVQDLVAGECRFGRRLASAAEHRLIVARRLTSLKMAKLCRFVELAEEEAPAAG